MMAHACLRKICATSLQSSEFLTLMADETTDASNKEQLVVVFRCVNDDLEELEQFVGLYQLEATIANIIVTVLKDVMLALNLDIHALRGGASVMFGAKTGVAKQIMVEEPHALFTHCYGQSLNLAVSDSIRRVTMMKDAMDTTSEIYKLIKFSPKRESIFLKLKKELEPGSPGIRVLCPTRWTVSANALKSVLDKYTVLQQLWQTIYDQINDTEV